VHDGIERASIAVRSLVVEGSVDAADTRLTTSSARELLEQVGVADGTRTRDNRNHNPGLYQLSYSHH